jgi:rRNA maturation protein Nop10
MGVSLFSKTAQNGTGGECPLCEWRTAAPVPLRFSKTAQNGTGGECPLCEWRTAAPVPLRFSNTAQNGTGVECSLFGWRTAAPVPLRFSNTAQNGTGVECPLCEWRTAAPVPLRSTATTPIAPQFSTSDVRTRALIRHEAAIIEPPSIDKDMSVVHFRAGRSPQVGGGGSFVNL